MPLENRTEYQVPKWEQHDQLRLRENQWATTQELSSLKADILKTEKNPEYEKSSEPWINKQESIKVKQAQDKKETQDQVFHQWVKGNFLDFQANLEQGSKEDPELRRERNLELKINNGIVQLFSYKNTINFNPKTGQIFVGNQAFPKKFLFWVEKDAEKVLLNSEYNTKKMKAIFGVMNIINRGLQLGETIKNKSADDFAPYHVEKLPLLMPNPDWQESPFYNLFNQRIEIENGDHDKSVLKVSSLKGYAEALGMQDSELAKVLVNYFNAVHKRKYAQQTSKQTNQARATNGYKI